MGEEGIVRIYWEAHEIVVHTHVGNKLDKQLQEAEESHEPTGWLNQVWRVADRLSFSRDEYDHLQKYKDQRPVWRSLKHRGAIGG